MISLSGIKAMLVLGGLSRLKIEFDDEQKVVNTEYVFRGNPGTRQIPYQEIINGLTIDQPGYIDSPILDEHK